jgi:hypothetical protein
MEGLSIPSTVPLPRYSGGTAVDNLTAARLAFAHWTVPMQVFNRNVTRSRQRDCRTMGNMHAWPRWLRKFEID